MRETSLRVKSWCTTMISGADEAKKLADTWPDDANMGHIKKEIFELVRAIDHGGTRKNALMTRLLRLIAMVYKLIGGDLRAVSEKNGFGVGPVEMVMVRGQLSPGLTRLITLGWETLNTIGQGLGVDPRRRAQSWAEGREARATNAKWQDGGRNSGGAAQSH